MDTGTGEQAWAGLMRSAQRGDRLAYGALLAALRRWLESWFLRRLPSRMLDDAVQETLIAVHEKRHTWDPARPFMPWLRAIARYKWIDALRRMEAAQEVALPDDVPLAHPRCGGDDAATLRALLARLKPAQAEAIRLVKLEGLSVAEASRRSGQGQSLVKVNIHRGLQRLKALAAEPGDEE